MIDQNLAAVLNLSFSECEANLGADNAAVNAMFQQAAGEGMTVVVATGDTGAAGCTSTADFGQQGDVNSSGYAVSGLASTPYTLAVGGTDFDITQEAQYWSGSNQPGCSQRAVAHTGNGVERLLRQSGPVAYYLDTDPLTFCNTAKLNTASGGQLANPFIDIAGGGGGVSSCITADVAAPVRRAIRSRAGKRGLVSAVTALARYPTCR